MDIVLNSIKFFVIVPVLSVNIYFTLPNSSLRFEVYTSVL